MARPQRYNADYYTHTADLRNDRRVKAIRTKFGPAGYGLLHMLLEALTDADHTALDTSPLELELLAGDFGAEATDIEALIKFGLGVGYFARNEAGLLTCTDLSKWLEPVFEKRNRSKNPPSAALPSQPAAETGVSVTETPQSKVKKSKVKESKEPLPTVEGAGSDEEIEPWLAPLPESPAADASHTEGGATDVVTLVPSQGGQWGYNPAQISESLVLPFETPAFRAAWVAYRTFREEDKQRQLTGGMQEQELLRKLSNLAGGDQQRAIDIITQTIAKGWKDLYKLDEQRPSTQQPAPGQSGGGQKPTLNAVAMAGTLASRRFQQPGGGAGDTGQTTGPYPGQGAGGTSGVGPH